MRLLALLFICIVPWLLNAQDTIVPGTFTVRKVYVGNNIPDGLGVFGNMGGTTAGGGGATVDTIVIKGKVLRAYNGDTTAIRSATLMTFGLTVFTDNSGDFQLEIPNNNRSFLDSVILVAVRHNDDWDTTVRVPYTTNAEDIVIVRNVYGVPSASMSRKERRREMLKRIFLPWMWFKKKEKLPPREKLRFTKGSSASNNEPPKLQVLSQVGD